MGHETARNDGDGTEPAVAPRVTEALAAACVAAGQAEVGWDGVVCYNSFPDLEFTTAKPSVDRGPVASVHQAYAFAPKWS